MGFLQDQNLTLGSSQPEVAHWESTPHLSSAVNNTIIVLGVLTFALQLCLVLFFMLRCWRLDNRMREALKHPDTVNKLSDETCFDGMEQSERCNMNCECLSLAPSSLQPNIYKQTSYQLCDAAASSPAVSAAGQQHEPITISLFTPSIPWDLVQH